MKNLQLHMQQAQPLAQQGRPSASRHGKGMSIVEVSLSRNHR